MIHQTLGGAEGQATDIEIYAKQMVKMKHDYAKLISEQSGKDFEEVLKDIERDNWMSSQETKDYGIIDHILEPEKK
jgi:ATP-dependent Clp protease protease subunit